MPSSVWAIARYTLLEYVRGRLLAAAGLLGLATWAGERFLAGLALTETTAVQANLAGAGLRLATVVLLVAFLIVSQVREAGDRTRDWLLAFPMPRLTWLGGRLLGHLGAAFTLAALAGLPLLAVSPPAALLHWCCGLALELLICTCMAVFLSLSLLQVPAALLAFLAWYLLARSMTALLLIAGAPLLADDSAFMRMAPLALKVLSWLMPRLEQFAPAASLVTAPDWSDLLPLCAQALAYALLVLAACALDLQRAEW